MKRILSVLLLISILLICGCQQKNTVDNLYIAQNDEWICQVSVVQNEAEDDYVVGYHMQYIGETEYKDVLLKMSVYFEDEQHVRSDGTECWDSEVSNIWNSKGGYSKNSTTDYLTPKNFCIEIDDEKWSLDFVRSAE